MKQLSFFNCLKEILDLSQSQVMITQKTHPSQRMNIMGNLTMKIMHCQHFFGALGRNSLKILHTYAKNFPINIQVLLTHLPIAYMQSLVLSKRHFDIYLMHFQNPMQQSVMQFGVALMHFQKAWQQSLMQFQKALRHLGIASQQLTMAFLIAFMQLYMTLIVPFMQSLDLHGHILMSPHMLTQQ
jgi:hypothetical protein